jgi:hypothetical protein
VRKEGHDKVICFLGRKGAFRLTEGCFHSCAIDIYGRGFSNCDICNSGDFDICHECIGLEGYSFDESYELLPWEVRFDSIVL